MRAHHRAQAEGDLAAQERARDVVPARQARRLPQRRRRAQRAVHRRGRQRARHRAARAQLRLPGAPAHPRQDPQRAEGVRERHAAQRRVHRDHPGARRRVRSLVRPRGSALRQDRAHDGRRRRRRPHPHPAAHPLLPVHEAARRGGARVRGRAAAAPDRGHRRRTSQERVHLHVLRGRARRDAQEARQGRPPLQGRHPAVQGPGEMDADQLAETTMDPRHRTLRRVTAEHAEAAERVFERSWAATSRRARNSSSPARPSWTTPASTSDDVRRAGRAPGGRTRRDPPAAAHRPAGRGTQPRVLRRRAHRRARRGFGVPARRQRGLPEDTAINLLIAVALGFPLARRALLGKGLALLILVPALFAAWEVVRRFGDPPAPEVLPIVLASLGAVAVNGVCAWLLRVRHHGGSLSRAAFLSARNDVLVNVAVIAMGLVTAWTGSGWPDLVLGCGSSSSRATPRTRWGGQRGGAAGGQGRRGRGDRVRVRRPTGGRPGASRAALRTLAT